MAQPIPLSQVLIQNPQLKSDGIALNDGPWFAQEDSSFKKSKMGHLDDSVT